eukprot:256833-Hanusia_phi.AAC.1
MMTATEAQASAPFLPSSFSYWQQGENPPPFQKTVEASPPPRNPLTEASYMPGQTVYPQPVHSMAVKNDSSPFAEIAQTCSTLQHEIRWM